MVQSGSSMAYPPAAATTTPTTAQSPPAFDLSALPAYSGNSDEDFTLWLGQLLAYFRAYDIPEDEENDSSPNGKRHSLLILSLKRDSVAQRYLLSQPLESRCTWKSALGALREHFASPARIRMRQEAARNALYTRAFRDSAHRGESVKELMRDFENLALQATLNDAECLQMFAWTFRHYSAASSMLRRALTLDVAFIEALRWERVLISKTVEHNTTHAVQ